MTERWDQILMEGMIFNGRIGVLAFEKRIPQPYKIDAVICCRKIEACSTDKLMHTINYASAYDMIRKIVENADCDLIERLAEMIAESLLECCPLAQAVEISVRKPKAPVDGEFDAMGVRIFRERTEQA